ncbi:MAG: DNA-binding protein [Gammaproteobacteria bacterium]|nr:MAG: DNA-binding protein [Gammaproteobacteria bacterium]
MNKQETANIEKFVVRLPNGMRRRIAEVAKQYHRSMNSEIVSRLELSLNTEIVEENLTDQVAEKEPLYSTHSLTEIHNLDLSGLGEEERSLIELILLLPTGKQKALISLLK